tara:strand:+ start:2413 stop:3609 length:1197 start_codon:yes stop_codon:yes gene_type:complete
VKLLKKNNLLSFYFIYLIVGTYVYLILQINEFPQKYVFTEWLINYEGGYVRKGLLGQIVLYISNIFNIDLKFIILFLQITIYSIYFFLFYIALSKIRINFFWILIIFSPILFAYPLIELMALGRKDTFVISIFLIFSMINYKNLNSLFFYFTIFFGISSLIHEITIFYIFHYLLIIYLYNKLIFHKKISSLHIISLLAFISFFLYLNLYLHNFVVIENIINSYGFEEGIITNESGAFSHLKPTIGPAFLIILGKIEFTNILKYIFVIFLNSIPFLYFIKLKKLTNLKYFSTKNIFFIFFILSLPVYGLVYDWGRVININYNFFIILLLFYFKLNLVELDFLDFKIKKLNLLIKIIFLIFICFIFSPDILSINPIEYFPLPSQFIRFFGGIFEKINNFY